MPLATAPVPASPVHSSAPARPGCVDAAAVFQHPLLEEPPRGAVSRGDRARHADLVGRARAICGDCPVRRQCLYTAVVEHDVAGYAAGTTARQRREIRRRLGVVVEPEDLDTLAGVVGGRRQIDHGEVVRLHRTHPDESLEQLAHRLGCSLSTIKRHLRRERQQPSVRPARTSRPVPAQVLQAAATVLGTAATASRAA